MYTCSGTNTQNSGATTYIYMSRNIITFIRIEFDKKFFIIKRLRTEVNLGIHIIKSVMKINKKLETFFKKL